MSFPRYPEYKDSGVEWLGAVPKHWQVKRIRHVAQLNPSKTEIKQLDPEMLVSFLPMEAVGDAGSLNLERETTIAEVQSGYTYFREGDVTYAKITPCFENGKGAHMRGLLNGIGFGSTELVAVRPDYSQTTSEYLNWIFRSPVFRRLAEASMYGAGGQKRVPDDFTRDFTLGFPYIEEQMLICRFLSIETAKLDNLMDEQEKLITLLKEKRQAVIAHAVTKGLDPTVTMKNSGVEWLGQVPEHWSVMTLGALASMIQTGPFGSQLHSEDYLEDETPVINPSNIRDGKVVPDWSCTVGNEIVERLAHHQLKRGDIVFGRRGEMGRCAMITENETGWLCGTGSLNVRLGSRASTEFVSVYLATSYVRELLKLESVGSTMDNLNGQILSRIPVPNPPLDEQIAIANFVGSASTRMAELIQEAEHAIDLLKERRTALISAAVTGQIDVRALVKGEQEQAA